MKIFLRLRVFLYKSYGSIATETLSGLLENGNALFLRDLLTEKRTPVSFLNQVTMDQNLPQARLIPTRSEISYK